MNWAGSKYNSKRLKEKTLTGCFLDESVLSLSILLLACPVIPMKRIALAVDPQVAVAGL